MSLDAKTKPSLMVSAVITRADGTVEDLGVIAVTTPKKPTFVERLLKIAGIEIKAKEGTN